MMIIRTVETNVEIPAMKMGKDNTASLSRKEARSSNKADVT